MTPFLLLSLACLYVVTGELTGSYLATFESKSTVGASGWFKYVVNSKNVGTYSWNIDLNDFSIPAAAVAVGCTMDIIKTSGLKYHIHTSWDNSTDSSNVCGSATSGCQGHYDPYLACSTTSQNYGSLCTSLNRISGSYTYGCNSTVYSAGHVALCEVGDLSGKFGAMKQISSTDYTFTGDAVDVNPPPAVYYGATTDVVSETPWNSIVFHCPVTSSPPRLFCAKLVQQDYTADDDINTLSNINDDDGDYSKYMTFRTVAIVFTVLTALMIAIVVTVFAKQRSDSSNKTLLSNNI